MENTNSATDLEMLRSIVSDTYKDAYGMRPRGSYWDKMTTVEACEAELARLQPTVEAEIELDAARERDCIERFESITIPAYITSGAKDRAQAIRWMIQEESSGTDYLEYSHGLPYGYLAKGE